MIRESMTDQALVCLNNIKFLDIHQGPEAQQKLQACIDTLYKVVTNVIHAPDDPRYKRLSAKSEVLSRHVFPYPNALGFLTIAGFQL